MCGIAGLISPGSSRFDETLINRLLARLSHRGPDDQGLLGCSGRSVWVGRQWRNTPADLILLHRRLSIIDLSDAGWQPMASSDGRYYVVYNGELYNYVELRQELQGLGHDFRSHSDTEVLLASYSQWRRDALTKFEGMFAFALLDRQERTLTLARDPFGIKPLYCTSWKGGLAFASEIKVLLELPEVDRFVNAQRLWHFLRFGITDYGEDTLFQGIHQVAAGHFMTIDLDRPELGRPRCYWSMALAGSHCIPFPEAVRGVRELFLQNITRHVRSDVPVGAALSGGIDSSAIVTCMRKLLGLGIDLHTVSYLADDSSFNEEAWVDMVVRQVSTVPHAVRIRPEELLKDLDSLITAQDEPFGSSSIYAQYRMFEAARQAGIKVMLDGQGADEIFAGYPYYLAAKAASLFREGQWGRAWRLVRRAADRWPGGVGSLLIASGGYLTPSWLDAPLRALAGKNLMPPWLRADWFRDREVINSPLLVSPNGQPFRTQLRDSLRLWSLPMLLRYEDRNSMAHSVESRVPFLTTTFVDYVATLPEDYLLADDGTSKTVFREAMRGIVPDAILSRRDKVAFTTPEAMWFRGPARRAVEELVRDTLNRYPAIFDTERTLQLVEHILAGERPMDATLWRIMILGVWGRVFSVLC